MKSATGAIARFSFSVCCCFRRVGLRHRASDRHSEFAAFDRNSGEICWRRHSGYGDFSLCASCWPVIFGLMQRLCSGSVLSVSLGPALNYGIACIGALGGGCDQCQSLLQPFASSGFESVDPATFDQSKLPSDFQFLGYRFGCTIKPWFMCGTYDELSITVPQNLTAYPACTCILSSAVFPNY